MTTSANWLDSSRDYNSDALFRVLILAALERSSVEDISNFQQELGVGPSPDTVMRALKRFYGDQTRLEIEQHVAAQLQQTVLQLPHFKTRRKVEVNLAIDLHDEEYYGKDLHDQSGERLNHYTPQSDKSDQALRYATLSIVSVNKVFHQPLTIGFVIQSIGQSMKTVVQRLLEQIDLDVKVKRLFLDGGFASVEVLKYLDEEVRIPWIARGKYSSKKEYFGDPGQRFPYDLKEGQVDEYRVEGYLFQETSESGSPYHILLLCAKRWTVTVPKARQLYRQRFRIENTYRHARVVKIRTSTRNIQLRWIMWAIAHFLELFWQLIRYVHEIQGMDDYLSRQKRVIRVMRAILELQSLSLQSWHCQGCSCEERG